MVTITSPSDGVYLLGEVPAITQTVEDANTYDVAMSGDIYPHDARGNGSQRTPWVFGNWGNSNLYMQFETTTGGAADCSLTTDDLIEGEWNHVAFTWDGTTVTSYVGAVAGPTDPTSGNVLANTDGSLKLGYIPSYTYFEGSIDEVRIWSTTLDATQLDDMTPPKITIIGLSDGDIFLVGASSPTITVSAVDGTGTGVDTSTWTYPTAFDASTAGIKYYTATVEDYAKNLSSETVMYVVTEPGFITGGGWIDSPEGAYVSNPDLIGKANFGFISKYNKKTNLAEGNTEFVFKAGDLNFHSNSYDWLMVNKADSRAQFKGKGTVSGVVGECKFMLWAVDGEQDAFRIKIWQENGGEEVIYDNGFDGSGYETGQPISGGSIVVHTSKK